MKPGQFPAKSMWWEIVYVGGTTVRGTTRAEWDAAPADGVLVVRQPVDTTYETPEGGRFHFTVRCHSYDYYWLDEDGLIQQGNALEAAGADHVKRGAWAARDEFRAVFEALGRDVFADESA